MKDKIDKLLWDYAEAANRLSFSEQALRDLVFKGGGPSFTRVGRRVMFRPEDVKAWVDKLAQETMAS
ncbi:MAG: helix-turn-helix domain-containing protein [Pseudomonadota bacterium]